jgi:glycosyltransferase involved in cell wall biosynthesis
LEYARGEYILYIDGDDYLYPHGLHYMITMLNAYPNAQMALMLSYNPNFIYPLELMPAQIYKSTFLGSSFMGISLTNTILRTSVLRKVGGFSTNYIAGDEYIRLKIALNHNALLINDGFTWHRERPGQAFEKLSNHWGTAEAMQYFKDVLSDKDCPLNDNEKKQALINVYGGLYRTLLRYLLRFRFKYAIKLFKHSGLSLKDAYMIIKKPVRNYKLYKAYTTIEEMNKNPFCLKSAIQ